MEWLFGLGVAALVGAVMLVLALAARRIRRRGAAGKAIAAAMAAYDEGFHSTAHDTFVEVRAQDERPEQAPASGTKAGSGSEEAARY